jgi:hypothetical protein
MVQDSGVEFFFGCKMPEDHCLRYARRLRDLFRRGPPKSALRKEADRHTQDLKTSFVPSHSSSDDW